MKIVFFLSSFKWRHFGHHFRFLMDIPHHICFITQLSVQKLWLCKVVNLNCVDFIVLLGKFSMLCFIGGVVYYIAWQMFSA